MLVPTEVMLAVCCPWCGKLKLSHLSRFALKKGREQAYGCSCGCWEIKLFTPDYKRYCLNFSCPVCLEEHRFNFSRKAFWSGSLQEIFCPDSGVRLINLGAADLLHESLSVLKNFSDEKEYFFNREVMQKILKHLYNLLRQDKLYCQCGHTSVEVLIFPERVELQCKDCGSVAILYGENQDDWLAIKDVQEICLREHGFEYLDSLARSKEK
ncbi:MAG: hypothetical protein MJ157_06250 [Clostridia bacterium]|nr:hypothetical protein [Clostridia bacterium]